MLRKIAALMNPKHNLKFQMIIFTT